MYISQSLTILSLPLLLLANPMAPPPGNHDCKGSFMGCKFLPKGTCQIAVLGYLPNESYVGYTARVAAKSPGGKGCTAIFECDGAENYQNVTEGGPANGTYLSTLFQAVFSFDKCGKCGKHQTANPKCRVRTDYCGHCNETPHEDAVALPGPYLIPGTVANASLYGVSANGTRIGGPPIVNISGATS